MILIIMGKFSPVITWLVWREMGNCPSTTSLYSLDTGAPKLTMLCRGEEGRQGEEGKRVKVGGE